MVFDFSNCLPNQFTYFQYGQPIIRFDQTITEINKKINAHYNKSKIIPQGELLNLQKDLTYLLARKQQKEVEILMFIEKIQIAGHFAELDPTWPS